MAFLATVLTAADPKEPSIEVCDKDTVIFKKLQAEVEGTREKSGTDGLKAKKKEYDDRFTVLDKTAPYCIRYYLGKYYVNVRNSFNRDVGLPPMPGTSFDDIKKQND